MSHTGLPLFPLVIAIAFLLALPLARLVSRRRRTGAALFMVGALAYLYFSDSGPVQALLLIFIVEVAGLAIFMGERSPKRSNDVMPTR